MAPNRAGPGSVGNGGKGARLVGRGLLLMVSTSRVMITGFPRMLQLAIMACAGREISCEPRAHDATITPHAAS